MRAIRWSGVPVVVFFKIENRFRQRSIALFLFAVTLLGVGIPPASVAVAMANASASNATISKSPSPLPQVKSKYAPAADASAQNSTKQLMGKLTGKANGEALTSPRSLPKKTFTPHELTDKRTAYSSTFQNANGSLTKTLYAAPHFYQNGSSWSTIDTKLVPDTNAADAGNIFGKLFGKIESLVRSPDTYIVKNNSWFARFAPSDFSGGMVRIKQGSSQIGFSPLHANAVKPRITTESTGQQTVHYDNLWNGIDVDYIVESNQVKEAIILHSNDVAAQVQFKLLGAALRHSQSVSDVKNPQPAFAIDGALGNNFGISPANFILNNFGQVSDQTSGLTQSFANGVLTDSVSGSYLRSLPAKAFPAVIDPTVQNSSFGTRAGGGNYVSFETNGYICNSNTCDLYAGSLYDQYNVLEYWRGAFYSPFNFLQGSNVVLNNANLHLTQLTGVSWWTGSTAVHNYQVGHALCLNNYGCVDGIWDSGNVGVTGDINVTNLYQNAMQIGDWGRWLMLMGQDGTTSSFKSFDPDNTFVTFTYSYVPGTPSLATPSVDNQVFVDPQVSFRVNPEANPNINAPPLQYAFRVSSGRDGSGTVVNSNPLTAPEWTIPDGVLQDGSTYYISVAGYDPAGGGYSAWSSPRPFKIDTRQGQDKTQTYDSVGPLSVNLATGDLTTGASSHTSQALGGNLGIGLNYNSPQRSRAGLVGEYWSVPANYPGGAPTRTADTTRVDQNIDFDWGGGAPASNVSNNWFYTRWSGYFVVPANGTYYFGYQVDDAMGIYVNNSPVNITGSNCAANPCFGGGVNLIAGQLVPLRVEYEQATGPDYAHLYVKGPVSMQVVPQAWLQTGVRPVGQNNGLIGHYYYDDGTHNISSASKTQFLSRTDSLLSFNWNGGAPIPNGPATNFMAQWTGYVTAPTTGDYYLGAQADDGSQIIVNGTTVENNWQGGAFGTLYGSSVHLTAGQPLPITVNYFQGNGGDYFYLYVKSADGTTVPEQIMPSSWLATNAQVLPAGWNLGIDPDGSVSYTHLQANNNDVVLSDASGDTFEYTWNGSSYVPPANGGGGPLTRNNDGTFTLQATDGRTYVFDTDGTLTSLTSPVDDRNPAALQYAYSGTPAHLSKITDGVTPNRYAQVFYSGASQCGSAPTGFDAQAPSGMICAVQTNDGRTTYFYYVSGNLARISQPGNANTDYQYDNLGRIVAVRDSLANDAVAAGIRQADGTETTQVTYDAIGRVAGVTLPAATAGATRQAKTYNYYAAGQPPLLLMRLNNGVNDHAALVTAPPAGYYVEGPLGYLLISQLPGTHPLYSCKISYDEFTSYDPNCEGQQIYDGLLGFAYDNPPSNVPTAPVYRCTVNGSGEHFDSVTSNCEGQHTETSLGYFPTTPTVQASPAYTDVRVTGASEPKGFTEEVTYDNLFRTIKNTNVEGLSTTTTWDAARDLQYASVDPLGLMTATVYDDEDRPVTTYGPAPSSWFSSSTDAYGHIVYAPQASYVSQVARSDAAYDQGMGGLSTSYATYLPASKSLTGAPFLHSTNFSGPTATTLTNDFGTSSPNPSISTNWGMTLSGKMRLPSTGNYNFRIASDGGVQMWIDGNLVINDWADGNYRSRPAYTFANNTSNAPHDVQIQYYHTSGDANFSLNMTPPGGSETTQVTQYFSPNYSLTTSTTAYDATLGNVTTATSYGNQPELGLPQSSTVSGSGTSLTTTSAYEAPGSGSYLRKTSMSLPGGATTRYSYYGASDAVTNPCVQGSAAAYQGGMLHITTQPTGVTLEKIYDDAGNVVASRNNSDPWTCSTFDSRGRVTQTIVPTIGGRAGRTLTYNYAVSGNPLVSSVTDTATGTATAQVDLLGRKVTNTDTFNYQTSYTYDSLGRPSSTQSLAGTQAVTYDSFSRPVTYTINGTAYATITYDQYGRTASVSYPQATNGSGSLSLTQVTYDAQQQSNGSTYTFSNGATYNENVTLDAQTGLALGDSITEGGKTAGSSYQYDGVGRLIGATVDNWKYQYGFGAQAASCATIANYNANAGDDGNRTTYSVTNTATNASTATNNCYNTADQLVTSSDVQVGTPTYDAYGDVTQLSGNGAPIAFAYNTSGQNTAIQQGGNQIKYTKDASGNVLAKEIYQNNVLTHAYRYAAGGNVLLTCDVTNESQCSLTDSYFALPGGVALTIAGTAATYSIQNFHGDTAVTVGSNGLPTSAVYMYDPFGQSVASATFGTSGQPGNASDLGMGWATSPTRKQESLFTLAVMQMGARVYLPSVGRFIQSDPVQGGTPNAYTYVLDPVNFADYNGQWGIHIHWSAIGHAIAKAAKVVAVAAVVVGVVVLAAVAVVALLPEEVVGTIVGAVATAATFISSAASRVAPLITRGVSALVRGGSAASTRAPQIAAKVQQTVEEDNNLPAIPEGWASRVADNGKGVVYQEPNSIGTKANIIRIMDPTDDYPDGYVRITNKYAQPLRLDGKPGTASGPDTHISPYTDNWDDVWPK